VGVKLTMILSVMGEAAVGWDFLAVLDAAVRCGSDCIMLPKYPWLER
jgi:hypothetical protein